MEVLLTLFHRTVAEGKDELDKISSDDEGVHELPVVISL
jgi:hypothetical protein